MVERQQHVNQIGSVRGDFYAQRALPCGGQAVGGEKHGLDACVQAQPFQPCGGENNGIVVAVIQLGEAGLHVAAQRADGEMREAGAQLRFAAQAGCADDCAVRQVFQPRVLVGNECVKRVGAFANRRQRKALRQIHRHVFNRMHG